jgi:cystathionine beta-lyase/cystathionine gamma-synthase
VVGSSASRRTSHAEETTVPGQQYLPPSLLRLSVGVERLHDLWVDLVAEDRARAVVAV